MNGSAPVSARVSKYKGKPVFMIDGVPVAPILYALTDTPGGRDPWDEIPRRNLGLFRDAGFHLYQIQVWLEDVWTEDDRLDIQEVCRLFRGVLTVDPEACIMLRLHINAPSWWNRKHPAQCTAYADGLSEPQLSDIGIHRHIIGDLDRRSLHSLVSEEWIRETEVVLERFCLEFSGTAEGGHLFGIQFCDGVSHEWHYWGFIEHEPDCSAAMTDCFRKWLSARYGSDEALRTAWGDPEVLLEKVEVPGMEYRAEWTREVFLDPSRDRRMLDYSLCQQESLADVILRYAALFRRAWPRPVVIGLFYGYYFMMFSRHAVGGHLCVDRVLDSPHIDFLSAPFSYYGKARAVGGTGQSRGIVEACLLRGKLWMTEQDQETGIKEIATIKNNSIWDCETVRRFHKETLPADIANIRRNALQCHVRMGGFWYFDFGPHFSGGWWDYPDYMRNISSLKRFSDKSIETECTSMFGGMSDILVVYDAVSYRFVRQGPSPISSWADDFSAAMFRTGVLFDNTYLQDLPLIDPTPYRVVIFVNCWNIPDELIKDIEERISCDDRTIMYHYMTGALTETEFSLSRLQAVTGFSPTICDDERNPYTPYATIPQIDGKSKNEKLVEMFGDNGCLYNMLRIKRSDHVRLYFPEPILDESVLRSLFHAAGSHIWLQSGETVFGGNGIVVVCLVHAATRFLQLPDGTEREITNEGPCTLVIDV